MFRATLYSSSGGQLYEYNLWYNHCVLVAVRYRTATNTEYILRSSNLHHERNEKLRSHDYQ